MICLYLFSPRSTRHSYREAAIFFEIGVNQAAELLRMNCRQSSERLKISRTNCISKTVHKRAEWRW